MQDIYQLHGGSMRGLITSCRLFLETETNSLIANCLAGKENLFKQMENL